MEDIEDLCENAISYQSTLIIAAITEILVSFEREDTEDAIRTLSALQKQLKYGILDSDEIAIYELGFADRIVAQALRPIISAAEGQALRTRIRNSATALREVLNRFPRYFDACLSSLL
jgi:hypothetical protein